MIHFTWARRFVNVASVPAPRRGLEIVIGPAGAIIPHAAMADLISAAP
jgi:hypothetical protein